MKGKGKVNGNLVGNILSRDKNIVFFRLDGYLSGKASLTSANVLPRTHLIALATGIKAAFVKFKKI